MVSFPRYYSGRISLWVGEFSLWKKGERYVIMKNSLSREGRKLWVYAQMQYYECPTLPYVEDL